MPKPQLVFFSESGKDRARSIRAHHPSGAFVLEQYLLALILGLIQGLTEFIPVSSTGHLIFFADILGFDGTPNHAFEVMIQLGSILAVVAIYFEKLWKVTVTLPSDPKSRRFALGLVLAFVPAAIAGLLLHDVIKRVLYDPMIVAVMLIVGGVLILVIERVVKTPRHASADNLPLSTTLGVGIFQALALIPGVSRSGATIMGALLIGVERRAAAEFSFFLAIPTMLAAFSYDLYKGWGEFTTDSLGLIAAGFVMAFISAWVVVRTLLDFVSRHGFAPFAWYRIVVGSAMLAYLWSA